MKRLFLPFVLIFLTVYAVQAKEVSKELKDYLIKKFPQATFRVDNSFIINNEIYLPLIPKTSQTIKQTKKLETICTIGDKKLPKMLLFSSGWIYIKVLKNSDGYQTILDLNEIPAKHKEAFLQTVFPKDLVVPNNFRLNEELAFLAGTLPISIVSKDTIIQSATPSLQSSIRNLQSLKGTLYLTSPDTGKIVFIELGNPSNIQYIQTTGAPWALAYDKTNKALFVTDFAKDKIYKIKHQDKSIMKNYDLAIKSSPREIALSEDGSVAYIVENLAGDFIVYKTNEEQVFTSVKLLLNPVSFSILKEANLIAITSPNTNKVVFLNFDDFSKREQLPINGSPEKIISDSNRMAFYVANRNNNTISVIDAKTRKIKNTIKVGEKPTSIILSPDNKFLYIGTGKSNNINIIDLDLETVIDTIELPIETQFPGDIKITKDGKYLVVTSETTNKVSIIDLATKDVVVELDVDVTTHAALLVED